MANPALSAPGVASNQPTSLIYVEQDIFDTGIGCINTLVQETWRNLSLRNPERSTGTSPNVAPELFVKPAPHRLGGGMLSQDLPSYDRTRQLLRAAVDHIYPLSSIVSMAQLVNILDNMHNSAGQSPSEQLSDEAMLLHMVVALGYLCSGAVHLETGCNHAKTESTRHFVLGRVSIDGKDIDSPARLQALLCMVMFLIATSKISAAHDYMTRASKAISDLGVPLLSSPITTPTQPAEPAQPSPGEMLQAALFLGTYICGLLGVPFALKPVLVEMTSVQGVVQADPDVRQLVRSERRVLELVAFELHSELFGILSGNRHSGAEAGTTDPGTAGPLSHGQEATVTRTYEAEKQLEWWWVRFVNVFPQGEVTPQIARLRFELQMSYFQVGLVLFHRFLPYHAHMQAAEPLTRRIVAFGNTGMKLAMQAISTSEEFLRYHQVCPASWSTMHSLFLAILNLILALTGDGQDDAELRNFVKKGTALLNSMSCPRQSGIFRHLIIIKDLADRFEPPIDIGGLPVTVTVPEPRPRLVQRVIPYAEMPNHPGAFRQRYQSASISGFCQRGQT